MQQQQTQTANPTAASVQEQTPGTSPVTPTPPAEDTPLLAGKYKTTDDLVAGYKELEKKLGETQPKPQGDPQKIPTPTSDEAAVTQTLSDKGIDLQGLYSEYLEKGELTAESRKSLNDAGFDDTAVDDFIAGRQARAQAVVDKIYEAAGGGEQEYTSLIEWGSENLSDAEIKSFNDALDSPDTNVAVWAIQSVRDKMAKASQTGEPNLVTGNTTTPGAASTGGFKNISEATEAMQKRDANGRIMYGYDQKYTAEIEAKLAKTDL